MDNNNNTNNASHAAIPPLRPDPPDPPGQAPATTTKSYSAAVGARSAAKHGNATANASTAVAAHPLMHNIENCVIINTPPSTSVEQVLLALDKYYPGLTGAMPCVIKGQRGLRFPKAADLDTLVANGLTVGKNLCKVEKLYSSTRGGVVQCTLTGFFSDPEGLCLFDEQIAAYGTVLRRRIQYIGKTKHISGVYDFILALKDVDVLPPASLSIARDGVTERIPLRITGGMRHCVFLEQDLAAQTEDLSNRAQPDSLSKNARPEFSFNFPCKTATPPAPQPASNQGIAYSLVEKSSESPSSETTSPSPSPPPTTPKSIITRSKSIAALSKPATPEPRAVFAHGAALRSRLDPSLAGPSSIFIRLRKVRASDLIPSLTVNDVVHSDPDSMLGAASDYFERVYEDRPIDDAALKAIIDGLASTRLSPADSLKLEEAYPLEEMTKAQAAFLCAVGLGPKARQWYRATYTNQSASIFLNGWLSATFDILSGVRQGDPLAPSLFVLAIEGFACQIRLRVKGIDIAGLQNVRELLFADDACCALHNLSDLDHLNRAIELYERASASKLSNVKSFLYPLGAFRDRSIAPDLGTWRLSDSQFRYLGIQVGVEIAEDAGWEDVKASTIARIRSIPMYDLPYAAKCSIINIYCYTKILYYSRFLPAPKSVVKEIEEAAMLAIHGRASDGTQRRPKVSRSRLCTPLDHGGFGLIDLPRRLAIDHAKWVFQLRAPDGCFTRHLFDIRIRLQAPNEPTRFTLKTTKLLPARWVRYFEAWALVTTLNPPELSKSQNLEQWATHVLCFPAGHGIQLSVNPTLFRGPDGEVMTPSSFVNASKRHQVFIFPPVFPKGHQKVFDLPEQRWNAWWKALRKVRRVHSDAEDTGHLLSLGSLHPESQVASPTSPHPNNRSTSCVMCLSEAPECLVHLAVGCPFARRLWSALSPTPHPVFVDFVCPVVSRSERRLVELRVLFFHSIWKLCRRRRFSSDLLEPITETEFEGLRASIQESKGRLVSL
ncbi:BQ5605_C002g01573 [Microbotryum silenes-dioicae]|uniref:BQ5605_C002g01573 protein n=1 Tax=Microbotryum silenes-dioicae TaxID=796604 RepID=A0A2X0LZ59_9BASI|nr:BQ5605_C002g01573 [Microbotryum silenes-dioicae]